MKVKIEAIVEFRTDDDYDQFIEYVNQQYCNLKAYGPSPLRGKIANALGLNKGMSSHLHMIPIFSFERVETMEVVDE